MTTVTTKVRICLMAFLTGMFLLAVFETFAQAPDKVLNSRLNTNRTSISNIVFNLPVAEEKSFWSIYEQYLTECENVTNPNALAALMNPSTADKDFSFLDSLLYKRNIELALRQQYFEKISKAMNGRVGIQFLQTEELLDLIVMAELYEKITWPEPFLFSGTDNTKIDEALLSSVTLEQREKETFVYLHEAYQYESSAIWGDELSWFEQYIEDISDRTPAQAHEMGREFIKLQQKEVSVKKKYFAGISRITGEPIAAQLMAWEDYRSILDKIKAWSNSSLFSPADMARRN